MESGLTNPPALIGTGAAKGVTSLVRIVCLIDEANRPESFLLTLVYRLNITPTVWASTWVSWAHFREPLVVGKHRPAHLLTMELIRVEVALQSFFSLKRQRSPQINHINCS